MKVELGGCESVVVGEVGMLNEERKVQTKNVIAFSGVLSLVESDRR